jgi:hypothetical protein
MKNAKFWLVQIAMVAIVSLVFGSPVFAGPPDHAKGLGAETSSNSHSNHSGGKAQAESNANENAAFMAASDDGEEDDCQVWATQMDPVTFEWVEVCQD